MIYPYYSTEGSYFPIFTFFRFVHKVLLTKTIKAIKSIGVTYRGISLRNVAIRQVLEEEAKVFIRKSFILPPDVCFRGNTKSMSLAGGVGVLKKNCHFAMTNEPFDSL